MSKWDYPPHDPFNKVEMEGENIMNTVDRNMTLLAFSESGVLPGAYADEQPGYAQPIIEEAIICDSISGGAQYVNDMPRELSLIRKLRDGTEYRAKYVQVDEEQS